ncbi:MAG: V-type ATP synthase subunit E [Euryarchaeota archaeon]|nr:V-type ATP synthase subunit E [Euryarchaeota archaeon]
MAAVAVQREKLEKIIARIEEDARAEVDRIMSDARAKAEEIKKEAELRARAKKEEILSSGRREAEQERARIVANAKLRARKALLDAKEEVIREAFSRAREELAKVAGEERYGEILKKLILEAIETIGGDVEIVARKEDKKILSKSFLQEISREAGVKVTLAKDTISSIGGVVVRSKDGKAEVDNTFETRLERISSELRSSVAKVLFK